MDRNFYIFEKPNAGQEFASWLSRKLGLPARRGDGLIMIGSNHVVSWCIGHLLKLKDIDQYLKEAGVAKPEDIRPDGSLWWRHQHFPFMPQPSEIEFVIDDSDKGRAAQANLIGKQIASADVIWHAADRDREGQLIVDELLEYFKKDVGNKPVKRLIYSALDDAAFEHAYANVGDNRDSKYVNAGVAALTRAIADAYIGIPVTRVLTSLVAGKGTLSAGRVQSPVLSIICDRFIANRDFKPKTFWTPVITLPDGTELRMKKGEPMSPGYDEEGRLVDKDVAQRIMTEIAASGFVGQITLADSRESKVPPPLPFDLASISSEMSKKHGIPVKETVAACQQLYNKKMQTYVGTECRYLPTSMLAEISSVMKGLRGTSGQMKSLVEGANTDLVSAAWDDSKINAHHAIIPTGESGRCENQVEQIVYDAVCKRYLAQFYPPALKTTDRIEAEFSGHQFDSVSSRITSKGWMAIESNSDEQEDCEEHEMIMQSTTKQR